MRQFFDALLYVINESSLLSRTTVTKITEFWDERGDTLHVMHSFSPDAEMRQPDHYYRQIVFSRIPIGDGLIQYTVEISRPWSFSALAHVVAWKVAFGWERTTQRNFDPSGRFEFNRYVTHSLDLALARREQWLYTLRREAAAW